MPATRRCVFACEMTASPSLQEPIFLVDITAPTDAQGGIYNCMNQRRGIIFHEEQRAGTNLLQMRAHLPVSESFGFTGALRQATSGCARCREAEGWPRFAEARRGAEEDG